MSKKIVLKPVAAALGAAFVTSLAGTSVANAAENPFAMSELASGYMVAEGQMPEGKCGEGMTKATEEGKCGEGKAKATTEGKCGEGKCGEGMTKAKAAEEGKCGEGKATTEGKCGEGMTK